MSLFDYDFEDLARQVQVGLERIAINFLRGHGARIHKDLVSFHGFEEVELELAFGSHSLRIHQVGRPRGADDLPVGELLAGLDEEFSSELDGWPSASQPREVISRWLATLPAGEAPPPPRKPRVDDTNPFTRGQTETRDRGGATIKANPLLEPQARRTEPNPFADGQREDKRKDALRWLKDD